jgi:hypothetical protein
MKIQWIEMDLGLPGSWSDRSRCGRLLPRLDGQLPSASCKAWGMMVSIHKNGGIIG